MTTKIKPNTTYYTRSIGDHNCIYELKVLARTPKTATIIYQGKTRKAKIYTRENGVEYLRPDHYSFAPSFYATETVRPLRDWEKEPVQQQKIRKPEETNLSLTEEDKITVERIIKVLGW